MRNWKMKALGMILALAVVCLPVQALAAPADATPSHPLAAGYLHSLMVKADGTVWAAGDNTYGQLGVGAAAPAAAEDGGEESSAPSTGAVSESTTFVKVMDDARAVYAGYLNSFAIGKDNMLYGWGWNEGQQLGIQADKNVYAPVEILDNVASVAAARFHTVAVDLDGTLWAWGWNMNGQLGTGVSDNLAAPKEVLTDVRSAAVGLQHTMAVKNDNTLWAAGDNSYGQLADGTTQRADLFHQVMEHVQDVACTAFGTLILRTDGTLWVCGYNNNGELGTGDYETVANPIQVLDQVSKIAAGENFAAAITQRGALYAWGSDTYSQYGATESASPLLIREEPVTDIALGGGHLLMLSEDGKVQALGNNEKGQLGTGSDDPLADPTDVAGGVAPTEKAPSQGAVIALIVGICVAVAALFAFLIVRTLKGKAKDKAPKAPKEKAPKEKGPSEKELIQAAQEIARQQEEKAKAPAPAPAAPAPAVQPAPAPTEAPKPAEPQLAAPVQPAAPAPRPEVPTQAEGGEVFDVESLEDAITRDEE